ncbi:MAG: DUF1634 domain-containing protein [Chloroflexota bacterium]
MSDRDVPPSGARPAAQRPAPGHRATRAVLRAGTIVSAAAFAGALALRIAGRPTGDGDALDPGAVLAAIIALDPWGWATLGVFAVIVTPVLAIAATGHEHRVAGDRRTALLALAVLGVLGLSLAVALLR